MTKKQPDFKVTIIAEFDADAGIEDILDATRRCIDELRGGGDVTFAELEVVKGFRKDLT